MSDALRDRLVAAVGDHYLIEAELGRGGMAAVYRALDRRLNRRVAIKLLPPDLAFNPSVRSRFLREAQMAARLTHANIVPIYTVDEKDGLVYFVMALVDGESVASCLARTGSMDVSEVRAIIGGVADALDFAHRAGVVHRDIKPDNILLDRETRRPMVTDFGIARAVAEEHRLTTSGMAVGTPAYMSPEQAMGERELDGRSDIYSLGIVAYQMLAGETPFRATNTPAMLMKHVSEPLPPLLTRRPDIPPDLARAVERSLAKRPEDRWRSAAEMRDSVLGLPEAHRESPPPAVAAQPRGLAAPSIPPAPRNAAPAGGAAPAPWSLQPPAGISPREMREWYRGQRRLMRDAVRAGFRMPDLPVEAKIARFRRRLVGYVATSLMLFVINAVLGGFPWFIFPVLGMMVGLMKQFGSLWGDGVPLRRILFGSNRRDHQPAAMAVVSPEGAYSPPAPPEILAGPHGAALRKAAASNQTVNDMLTHLTANERAMLPPDLEQTVRALVERVVAVGTTLHRLDSDANGATLGTLDARLAGLKSEHATPELERRISLLERQRATLRDLLERRTTLLAQFESATVALENLKLDLVRFRSAGVSTALEDVSSATREARAVSRDIGHMLEAADEVRRL